MYSSKACKDSLNGSFMEDFITLNTITFADMVRREKIRISWDVTQLPNFQSR